MQLLQKFLSLAVGEANGVIVEIPPSFHVINVVPIIVISRCFTKKSQQETLFSTHQMLSRGISNFSKLATTSSTIDQLE